MAIRVRDLLRQIAMEHEIHIINGKVARDHVHLLVSGATSPTMYPQSRSRISIRLYAAQLDQIQQCSEIIAPFPDCLHTFETRGEPFHCPRV